MTTRLDTVILGSILDGGRDLNGLAFDDEQIEEVERRQTFAKTPGFGIVDLDSSSREYQPSSPSDFENS
jgi:hypothetical protein